MMVAWMAFQPVKKNRSSIILHSSYGGSLQLMTEQQFWLKALKQSIPILQIRNKIYGQVSAIFSYRSCITLKMLFSPKTSSILITVSRKMTKRSRSWWLCKAWKLDQVTPSDCRQQMMILSRMQFIPWLYSIPELEEANSIFLSKGARYLYLAFSYEKDRLMSFSICSASFQRGSFAHKVLQMSNVSSDIFSPEPFLALSDREVQ